MPKISVAMSVFNGEEYLEDAIESILNQSYSDFEFIICDDGSSDKSVDIIKRYMKNDGRIKLIENKVNLGLSASLNKCIELANGEYIARMDADDIAIKDRFIKQAHYLDQHPDVAFVCGGVYLIDDNGVWGERINKIPLTKENIFKYQPISHPTTMIRRSVLDQVKGYTVESFTRRGQDFDLWCKIYHKGFIGANTGDIVLYYREHQDSYKKRKFKYRLHTYKLKRIWRRRMKLPLYFELYSCKPIIVGLIPKFLLYRYHRKKFKNFTKK